MDETKNVPAPDQRHLALEGSYNIRDIGGYATLDGHTTRWRTLLRADSLHNLSPASQRALLEYPVKTIIDLRRTKELHKQPSLFAQSQEVRYINISLLEDEQKVIQSRSLYEIYRLMLESYQEQILSVLSFMTQEDVFPCLVHCAIGKDRTGLIIALLLSIGNVPASTIASDYALSEQYLHPLFQSLRLKAQQDGKDIQRFEWVTRSREETMLETLAYLDEHYGSVRGYLESIGITKEQMETLRTILCFNLNER
jgi:protein-tyrosine phosphatase